MTTWYPGHVEHVRHIQVQTRPVPAAQLHPELYYLPVEIWTDIFALAVHIPGAFDIDDHNAITAFTRDSHGICLGTRFKTAMQTKLACSLVCRDWHCIIRPFIFEYLRIRSGGQACAIAEALERMSEVVNPREGPGKWTIRIDLAFEGVHYLSVAHTEAIIRIFRYCYNLVCFSTAFSSEERSKHHFPMLIMNLGPNHSPKLKRVEVRADKNVLPIVESVLGDSLEVLWLVSCGLSFLPAANSLFPKIHTLIAPGFELHLAKIKLPNLRACVVHKSAKSISTGTKESLIEYLSVSEGGKVLSSLDAWTNLVTLSVKAGALLLEIPWKEGFQHQRLECIMITDLDSSGYNYLLSIASSCEAFSRLHENLTHIISQYNFPSLDRIRLFLPVRASYSVFPLPDKEKEHWGNWFKKCHEREIPIEVSQGAMEWTGNQWEEIPYEELMDILNAETEVEELEDIEPLDEI